MLEDLTNAWKAFFASCWLWKHFPCKKLSRCLKKWESVGRSQVRQSFIVQFIQLLKCWLCDLRALSWRRIRPILLTNAGYRHCSFWCISWIQKGVVDQADSRPPNSDHDAFWCRFNFGKCFGASFWFSHWAGCQRLSYKIHFLLHITIQSRNISSLLHRIRKDNTLFFLFFSSFLFFYCFK